MKGYKVFNPDWTCRGFQFEVGKTYEENVKPMCRDRGFHFCIKAIDCFNYYEFDSNNKVAEIEALGEVATQKSDTKCATNKIHIIRELSWYEVLDLVNTGRHNTGYGNSGDYNSDNYNSGNYNSGTNNSGDHNSGHDNSGHHNSGHNNIGNCNSGHGNSGDWNSGYRNSGDYNSGHGNSGYNNSGNWNSGYYNSGYHNSGNWNSGHNNRGHWNSGDWNKTNHSSGCFNRKKQKIMMFDKLSEWTFDDWDSSKARNILFEMPKEVQWILVSKMRNEEKENYPKFKTAGGFLKVSDVTAKRQMWWDNLSDKDKTEVMSLPNFDSEIFYEITGIKVN